MSERRDLPVLSNPRSERVKAVRGLSRRSARVRTGYFLAEGPQSVREAVLHRPDVIVDLYVDREEADGPLWCPIVEAAGSAGVDIRLVDRVVLGAMADTPSPQGGLAVCRQLDLTLESVLARAPRVLCVLTHVRDPGNAGTVLRGADATAVDAVLLTEGSVDLYNPKVVRSTAGSLFHVPVVTGVRADELFNKLPASGVVLLAADGRGRTSLHEADLQRPHAWIFGNEAWGLTDEIRDRCNDVVRVPIYGRAESLNLAMAATMCLYASAAATHEGSSRP
ncbi:RNA methyltransferase, TrmH family [Austwickia chelonae]|uniref:Putative RNA methyltransferase n=1 Tax=Austwickia chelonae NBRC 105200 TaxID=1184607 RepID=K6UKJ7_9MICO|nr:RNA methyltransferase [Austwickia chelonae]GAB76451.1 putative RNA methyltransferase [Austwickia chelonae NBRC 105200]SEW24915.1 RNA methyltransferase, TrmH family [Austwickia chelonae]